MGRREAYRQLAEAQLEEQKARIRLLKARARKLIAQGKVETYKQIDDLELQLGNMRKALEGLVEATDDAWEELRISFEKIRQQVSLSIQKFTKSLE